MDYESCFEYVKHAILMWLSGFKEACSLYRLLFFCKNSRPLLIRTGQCFLLNGLIFLGSIFILNTVVVPILLWILPDQCWQFGPENLCDVEDILKLYAYLRFVLVEFFNIFWFYPLYILSIVLSSIWYNDIAKHAFAAMGKPAMEEPSSHNKLLDSQNVAHVDKPAGLGGVIIGIGEQVYSLLLLSFFFIEVYATGFIPYIGKTMNFLLLSWMYAYYSFEYQWNLSELSLDKRLDLFESNWAFFLGFGSPCVFAIFFFSPLVSYGVMAVLFPLFVLTATGTRVDGVIESQKRSWTVRGLGKLPIFYVADTLAMKALYYFVEPEDKDHRQDKKLK